VKENS